MNNFDSKIVATSYFIEVAAFRFSTSPNHKSHPTNVHYKYQYFYYLRSAPVNSKFSSLSSLCNMYHFFFLCSRRNLWKYTALSALLLTFSPLLLSAQQTTKRTAVPASSVYLPETNSTTDNSTAISRLTTTVPASNISVATPPVSKKQLTTAAKFEIGNGIRGTAEYRANGTIAYVEGTLGKLRNRVGSGQRFATAFIKRSNAVREADETAQLQRQQMPVVQEVLALLARTGLVEKIQSPAEELRVISLESDALGYQHIRFEQRYKGLRIYGQDLYVHAKNDGSVYAVHGAYQPTPRINTDPVLTSGAAVEASNQALKNAGEWNQIPAALAKQLGYEGAATELLLYPHKNTLRLVYAVTVCPTISESWMYFIDANTGASLDRLQLHRYDDYLAGAYSVKKTKSNQTPLGKGSSGENNTVETPKILDGTPPKGAETQANQFVNVPGKDLLNRDRVVQGYQAADGTIFPLSSESNFRDTPADRLPRRPNGGHIVLDANGVSGDSLGNVELTVRTTTSGQPFSPQVTSALAETDSVLRYFRTKFNRTSWDDKGSFIQTIINIGGGQAGQAWWNPGLIAQGYGPGDPGEGGAGWRDLHLVGHEVGHAYNTPGRLNYGDDQGGAIEEHLANFWGWMVNSSSFYIFPVLWPPATSSAAWHMSAEPDSCGDGNKNLPRSMADFLPRTDPGAIARKLQFPHHNGPIVDRAAWFVVNKYGRDTTSQIWHRALINYITQDTRFGAFRRAIVQSAQDLFPTNTTLVADINSAFDRVGITLTTGTETTARLVFAGKEQPQVQAIRSSIAFSTQSGRIGLYDPATRRATYFTGNDAVVRTQVGRSRLSAPRTGNTHRLYFVNTQGRLAFLDLLQGRVTVFQNLQIRQAGDIVSAAISPDERTVAMTSQYDNDAAVYIATLTGTNTASAVQRVSLERLAAAGRKTEGKQVSGIRFPDAVSWSPDSKNPELVLDAMSSLRVGKDSVQFWGLYYASFQTPSAPAINDVFPPQPGYDLGYPTFSSNNPNTLAFGETSDGTTDMYIANFDKSEDTGYLNIPNFTLGGRAVTDADQATFSPDDTQLAMVSPSSPRNLLLYSFARTGAAAQLQAITLDSTVNRPFWANLDVATGVSTDNTNGSELGLSITPNPSSGEASVRFVVPQSSNRVTLKVFTALGQECLTVTDGTLAQGNYTLPIVTESLTTGVYLCRLQVGSIVAVQKISVVR